MDEYETVDEWQKREARELRIFLALLFTAVAGCMGLGAALMWAAMEWLA